MAKECRRGRRAGWRVRRPQARRNGESCEGSDADIGFSAGLEMEADSAEALLSIKLEASRR